MTGRQRHREAKGGVHIEETDYATLAGMMDLTEEVSTKGLVRLTKTFSRKEADDMAPDGRVILDAEGFSELGAFSGHSAIVDVLATTPLLDFGQDGFEADMRQMIAAGGAKVSWDLIERRLATLSPSERGAWLAAVYAELYEEPLGDVWLAASAQLAAAMANNFAFGYLTALLHQRRNNEASYLRGKKVVESAGMGGRARAARNTRPVRAILAKIRTLNGDGHSVKRAAELAYKTGFGASAEANRRLWYRHSSKL